MARTFDVASTIGYMNFYDVSATTWYARNVTTGDYFTDTADVGDCLYFVLRSGSGSSIYSSTHNLNVNVGTPLAATSITLVWEFFKRDDTWATLSVTDNTNSFQNAGANSITWTIPDEWTSIPLANLPAGTNKPTSPAFWHAVRARISAVTGLTEGGANSTSAITTNNWCIKIPSGDSVTLADLLSDDTTGGWGVVTTDTDARHYKILANLEILSGATLTIQDWEELQLGTELQWMGMLNAGTFTMGLKSGNDYNEGARFIYYNHLGRYLTTNQAGSNIIWTGTWNVTNSYVWKRGSTENPSMAGSNYFYNSIFEAEHEYFRWYFPSAAGVGEIKNAVFSGPNNTSSRGLYFYTDDIVIDNIILGKGAYYAIGATNANLTNTRIITGKKVKTFNNANPAYATDCIFEDPYATAHSDAADDIFYVRYTLNLTVLDVANSTISSPTVRLVDSQSTELFNGTWSSDLIVTVWGKNLTTVTDYNPMEIWISKSGYETYYQKFTLGYDNRKMTIRLRNSPTQGRDSLNSAFR